jgi:hypothetical protein
MKTADIIVLTTYLAIVLGRWASVSLAAAKLLRGL